MLAKPVTGGIEIAVRVTPGASRTRIVGRHGDRLKVQVQAPPERGKANEMVCAVIAKALDVRLGSVRIVRGAAGRDKIVQVDGVGVDATQRLDTQHSS